MVKCLQRIPAWVAALAALSWGTSFNIGTTTVGQWIDNGKCSLDEAIHAVR